MVAVSEGIRYENGGYVGEDKTAADVFGHSALGGVCGYLKNAVKSTGVKCKAIELNILQRCAAHIASETDVNEAFEVGRQAVIKAVAGETDEMVSIKRKKGAKYEVLFDAEPLEKAANAEKKIPLSWIKQSGTGLTEEFIDYALPLISGENERRIKDGLPSYAKLKLEKFRL